MIMFQEQLKIIILLKMKKYQKIVINTIAMEYSLNFVVNVMKKENN